MPSSSEKQRQFMGAELARERAGKETRTHMSERQLVDFARKPIKPNRQHKSQRSIKGR